MISSMAIAVASVAVWIAVALNLAASVVAAFLILFSLFMVYWSSTVIGRSRLMSLLDMISWNSSSLAVHSMSHSKVFSEGKKFLIRISSNISFVHFQVFLIEV
jgi:hypothetical protein